MVNIMKVKCIKSENECWIVGSVYFAAPEGSGYYSVGHDGDDNAGYNLVLNGHEINGLALFYIPVINVEFIEQR